MRIMCLDKFKYINKYFLINQETKQLNWLALKYIMDIPQISNVLSFDFS